MDSGSQKNITVNITFGTIVKTILTILLFVGLYLIRDVVLVVLASVVIASSIEPMTRWFGKYGVSRLLAVVFVYFVLGAFLVGIFYSFIPTLLNETANLLGAVPRYIDSVSLWDPLQSAGQTAENISTGLSEGSTVVRELSGGQVGFGQALGDFARALSTVSGNFIQLMSSVFGGVLSLVLIIVLSFYLAVQEDGIAKFLRVVVPKNKEEYIISLWKRSQLKIGYWMQGQLLLAILVGVFVFLALTILGVRNALVFAVLAAIFETIPLFGPILAAIPAVGVAYADSGLSVALLVAGAYLIIQQFENHLFYPLVVKKIVGVPPILVILALIIGGKLAGFLGLLLSVPVAATLMEFFDDLERSKIKRYEEGQG